MAVSRGLAGINAFLGRRVFCRGWVLCGLALALTSCSHLAWWRDKPAGADRVEDVTVEAERVDHEAALRRMVLDTLAAAPEAPDDRRGKLVRHKPYFFKEYAIYPDGSEAFRIEITEVESRTAPFLANVTVRKFRFTTPFRRKKEAARNDDRYFRDTGVETLTYECRNGKWTPLGSFFVVEHTEENINGEWVPLEREVLHSIAEEEQGSKGWFGRAWSRFTGRN